MKFQDIAIWRAVGIRREQEIIIDLLLADSTFLRTALGRRQAVTFGVSVVPILTLEDLILLKMLAGRLQDRADLEKIGLRKGELQVDWDYDAEWKEKLGLEERQEG